MSDEIRNFSGFQNKDILYILSHEGEIVSVRASKKFFHLLNLDLGSIAWRGFDSATNNFWLAMEIYGYIAKIFVDPSLKNNTAKVSIFNDNEIKVITAININS